MGGNAGRAPARPYVMGRGTPDVYLMIPLEQVASRGQ